jgi:hypothetical protein
LAAVVDTGERVGGKGDAVPLVQRLPQRLLRQGIVRQEERAVDLEQRE